MSIVERINSQAMQMGANARVGFESLLLLGCKLISGLVLGLTFALVGQEVSQIGPVLFWFIILVICGSFLKISKTWGNIGLLIFDLLFILAALLIRMYVVIAPG